MKKIFLLSSVFFLTFLSNSFVSASTFDKKFGTITPVDTKFISKQIVLTCDEKFQKGEKRFQGFISSEYVWAYRNSGKFINLLFGYKTKSKGFRIEVLEKGLDGRIAKYYNFHDKNSAKPQAILTGKVTGFKKKLGENWYSCSLNYLQPNSQNKNKKMGEASIRELRRELHLFKTFQRLQKRAVGQLSEENHQINLYLDFQSHTESLKQQIEKIEAASKEIKQANSSQQKVSNFEQIQQQKLDNLMAQNKHLSEKLSKLNSNLLGYEKELKKTRAENASLKGKILSLTAEKPKIKNEEKYNPSVARLLVPEISHDYLDNFEKNTVGANTTEQIVDLIDKIISLDRKNKQQKSQYAELISELEAEAKIQKAELKSELEAADLRIYELELSLEETSFKKVELKSELEAANLRISELEISSGKASLNKSKKANSNVKKEINWLTDCKIGANKIFPITEVRTRQPEARNRAVCLKLQAGECWMNIGNVAGPYTKKFDRADRSYKMALDMDVHSIVAGEVTHLKKLNIKSLYWEAIMDYRDVIIEMQKLGASCSGPLE